MHARANIYKRREGRVRQAREKLPAFEFRMVVDDEKPVDRVERPADLGRRRLLLCCMRIIGKKEIFGGVQIPCDVRFNPVAKSWTARNIASLVVLLVSLFFSFSFSFYLSEEIRQRQ